MADSAFNPAVFWAKLSPRGKPNMVHPLVCHMIDVAAVAGLSWDHCLIPAPSGAGCQASERVRWQT